MRNENLSEQWEEIVEQPVKKKGLPSPKLVVLDSAYREVFDPLLDFINKLSKKHDTRSIAVIIPELIERRWYHFLIPHRATLLKSLLLWQGNPQIIIINTPWYLR
jgi:hypothetical protein